MNKLLLNDEELSNEVNRIIGTAILKNDKNYSWEMLELIKSQKQASEIIGASKAADAINKELGLDLTANGSYYLLRGSDK